MFSIHLSFHSQSEMLKFYPGSSAIILMMDHMSIARIEFLQETCLLLNFSTIFVLNEFYIIVGVEYFCA